MLPDRVSNPGPLTYESGVLPIALHGPANTVHGFPGINRLDTGALKLNKSEFM